MSGKRVNKNLGEDRTQIFWLFDFIPLIRIKYTVKVIPQGKVNCGAIEILEDGQNRLLFEIGNAQMLVKCMSDALDLQFRDKKFKRHIKSLARFSVNNTTKQIINLLQSFGGNK